MILFYFIGFLFGLKAMSSPEDKAYEIMRELDVGYVLVIFGGLTGYASDGKRIFHAKTQFIILTRSVPRSHISTYLYIIHIILFLSFIHFRY